MKKFLFILLMGSLLISCAGKKDHFSINGKILGADSGMVYLQERNDADWIKVDSSVLAKGEFSFKGKVDMPEMMFIRYLPKQVFVPVFVENARIGVEIYADSSDKIKVTGSATHEVFSQYKKKSDSIGRLMEVCYKEYRAAKETNDSVKMKKADSVSEALDKASKTMIVDFARSNNSSVVSPYLVISNAWQFELPELEEISKVFDTSLNRSVYLQSVKKRVDVLKAVQVGQIAPDFTMNDTTGNPLTLSSFRGKILLVDFWASWCGPCRRENPNVVKAYKGYNSKGFDVFGVSFDMDHKRWVKAIKDDGLTWNHVSDLKGWGNAAGKLYGIMSIPSNVLLDKDLRIIGRNLREEALLKKLEEVLGAPVPEKKGAAKKGKK